MLARAEAWKKKSHRLSLDLRIKSIQEAKRFLKDHSLVLWEDKAELPNLLDAMLGRIANERERAEGRAAETCHQWRRQLLKDSEVVECRFFRRFSTAIHQDLWPSATLFARRNRELAEEKETVSRDALKIMKYLTQEGAATVGEIRKALRYDSALQARSFHRGKRELQERLIILASEEKSENGRSGGETLTFWSSRMPKQVISRAEQIHEGEARLKLLASALDSCVLSDEKSVRRWFAWDGNDPLESVEELIAKKALVRVNHQKQSWIIPRKLLR